PARRRSSHSVPRELQYPWLSLPSASIGALSPAQPELEAVRRLHEDVAPTGFCGSSAKPSSRSPGRASSQSLIFLAPAVGGLSSSRSVLDRVAGCAAAWRAAACACDSNKRLELTCSCRVVAFSGAGVAALCPEVGRHPPKCGECARMTRREGCSAWVWAGQGWDQECASGRKENASRPRGLSSDRGGGEMSTN
ncbi:hypothetical protein THAOC_23888, partial [Thalassiosira oceanica]